MVGAAFRNEAHGFKRTFGIAKAGGQDRAVLADSAADDRLVALRDFATLTRDDIVKRATGFAVVTATAVNGGLDRLQQQAIDYVLQARGRWIS